MAVGYRDYYEALGVPRDASTDDIRRAYRKLARENHPDVNKDPGAEDRFKEISEAYEVLRDPERRAEYDQIGSASGPAGGGFRDVDVDFGGGDFGGGFGASGFSDFFESFFGDRGGARGARTSAFNGFSSRGADEEAALEVSLEEAATGGRRRVSLADGRGYTVQIPRGVRDGQLIRLSGEGRAGAGGGPPGDLLLRVRLRPHPRFNVEGSDLHTDLPVSPWEAALGATVELATLTGTTRVKVPPGSSCGRRLRLRGEGLPGPGGAQGDLYAGVQIKVPRHLTGEERELFERLSSVSSFEARARR
jgi:curved DNA-binding protein